jgi:hypothetical protein
MLPLAYLIPTNNPAPSLRRFGWFLTRVHFIFNAEVGILLKLNIPSSCLYSQWKQNDVTLYQMCYVRYICTATDVGKQWLMGVVFYFEIPFEITKGISVLSLLWTHYEDGSIQRGSILGFNYV